MAAADGSSAQTEEALHWPGGWQPSFCRSSKEQAGVVVQFFLEQVGSGTDAGLGQLG